MKKRFLLFAAIIICTIAYFNIGPEKKQYMVESDIQAYLNMGFGEKQDMEQGDFQAYTPTGSKKKRYYLVKHHKPRESTLGFSITPPPGQNWYEKLENDSLFYVKINKAHTRYSILTEAREVQLSKNINNAIEIQNYVRNEKEKYLTSSKFKKPNLTVQVEKSLTKKCVRYSQSYQDHGMKGLRGQRYVNVDTQGLFCLHPDKSRVAIDINYVEKTLSNTRVKSYSSEGERFLTSLKFH